MVEMGMTWVEMAGVLVKWVAWLHRLHEEEGGLSQEHYGETGEEGLHGRWVHPSSPPVQGATVLHRLARWHGIEVQGAT
jgi:hypothetical protein